MSSIVKEIAWARIDSQFNSGWIYSLPGIKANYCIWIDRETGGAKVSGLDGAHTSHPSIQAAKDWCQIDFNNRIKALLK